MHKNSTNQKSIPKSKKKKINKKTGLGAPIDTETKTFIADNKKEYKDSRQDKRKDTVFQDVNKSTDFESGENDENEKKNHQNKTKKNQHEQQQQQLQQYQQQRHHHHYNNQHHQPHNQSKVTPYYSQTKTNQLSTNVRRIQKASNVGLFNKGKKSKFFHRQGIFF